MVATPPPASMGKFAVDLVRIAGTANLRSGRHALDKVAALRNVLQEHFQDVTEYDGREIGDNDVCTAIKYVISKKQSKAARQLAIGQAKMATFVLGAATGATLGSILPVAGTAVGGLVGGVSVSTVGSALITASNQLVRKAKWAVKKVKGTQGVNRSQAAFTLVYCWSWGDENKNAAAGKALKIILEEEFETVWDLPDPKARIAARMKSV